jgi:hypothetical protein
MMPAAVGEGDPRLVALALLAVPLAAGALLGYLLRSARGRRVGGAGALLGCLMLPTAAGVGAALAAHGIGTWDGLAEGFLLGVGLAATAHAAFADRRAVAVGGATLAAGLLLLEGASRLLLPPPPAFPPGSPHLILNEALRRNEPIFGGGQDHICTIAYPGVYQSRYLRNASSALPVRPNGQPEPAAPTRRVLHVGDSMTYGFGVADHETYEAALERLEPGARHLNGAIIGTGPDSYLVLLKRWVAETRVDLAVVPLFEGNDLSEIDKGHQCSEWRPLLAYGPRGAALRFPDRPHESHALWEVARSTSPPPYLLRVAVTRSKVAALLAAAMAALQTPDVNAAESDEVRWEHLEMILRAMRDDLRARAIPLVVVVLPLRQLVERGQPGEVELRMIRVARAAGVSTLAPGDAFRAAVARGERPFLGDGNDSHLGPAGHRLLAAWLHERLPTMATPSPGAIGSQPPWPDSRR